MAVNEPRTLILHGTEGCGNPYFRGKYFAHLFGGFVPPCPRCGAPGLNEPKAVSR